MMKIRSKTDGIIDWTCDTSLILQLGKLMRPSISFPDKGGTVILLENSNDSFRGFRVCMSFVIILLTSAGRSKCRAYWNEKQIFT